MKKIGIITHYYKSINYGGNLQAYALCTALKKLSICAEQICYPTVAIRKRMIWQVIDQEGIVGFARLLFRKVGRISLKVIKKILKAEQESDYDKNLAARRLAFEHFNAITIPNNGIMLDDDAIGKSNDIYDAFITGSDQVWNFNLFRPGYFLGFVQDGKKKMSYAASVSMNSYSEEQKEYAKEQLKDYYAISVREDSAKAIIQELTDIDVKVVVDPVLLLDAEDWKELCKENDIEVPYIFAYFLGDNAQSRVVCNKFAEHQGLKIVTIHMAGKDGHFIDEGFGDIVKNDASPEEFITLIKNAKYILTDSFHATVFSYLLHKQFYVFDRNEKKSMNARIVDITKLFGTENRYCSSVNQVELEYMLGLCDIDYSKENVELKQRIEDSYKFLKENLEGNNW